jgi:hypothetical protein
MIMIRKGSERVKCAWPAALMLQLAPPTRSLLHGPFGFI